MKDKIGVKIFDIGNYLFLLILSAAMLFPFVHILAKSLSNHSYVLAGKVVFWPIGFNIEAYKHVLSSSQSFRSLCNSVFITVIGTIVSMLLTIISAYPLSIKKLPFSRFLTLCFIITMFFNGGMIPTYLVVKEVGLIDSLWALILPLAIIPFNLILLKSFFQSIPTSLEEAARIDGASYTRILFQIVVPLSKPSIATISMFYAVRLWNDFFQAMMYIQTRKLIPLQVYLRDIIVEEIGISVIDYQNINPETVKSATIIFAVTPILIVYPLVQKYFVKGVMIGAIKG